jgi:outer membrane protein assembly factor BamB
VATATIAAGSALTAAGAAAPAHRASLAAASSSGDWPMFHHDATHSGVDTGTIINATNASTLAVNWEANTGSGSYSSPVVATDPVTGRQLVYVGNLSGFVSAYDAITGQRVWWYKTGSSVLSSPAVSGGVVYIGSSDHYLYALNADTGALICRGLTGGANSAAPVVVNTNGVGPTVFMGDNGLTSADDGGHMWAIYGVIGTGNPLNCTTRWMFDAWGSPPGSVPLAGSWSPPAYAVDADGRDLVVLGSSSPDDAVYALNANTGALVWRFQTFFKVDADVGAGVTITAPGVNGIAGGAVYVAGKDNDVYGLNLTTGAQLWSFDALADDPTMPGALRSTPAILGRTVYLGSGVGVLALDAVTGAKVWRSQDVGPAMSQVLSSPAITGPSGKQVLFVGDAAGIVHAVSLATGASLWTFDTGGTVYASPAISNGKVYISSASGFLFEFGFGGGVSAPPQTVLSQPVDGSTITLPSGGPITVSGSATDDTGVQAVEVAVKNKNTAHWWSAATGTWVLPYTENPATLAKPKTTSTTWSTTFPASSVGTSYYIQADALDIDSQEDPSVSSASILVETGAPPVTTITNPTPSEIFYFPSHIRFPVTVTGLATDASGAAHPGITAVDVVIENLGHREYYCGFLGCAAPGGSGETTDFGPVYTVVQATLTNPGAASTTYSITFNVYDHPHDYRIVVWAVDSAGVSDPLRPAVMFCTRLPGDNVCK